MLTCNLNELALDGALWSALVCMFVFSAVILAVISVRYLKKK